MKNVFVCPGMTNQTECTSIMIVSTRKSATFETKCLWIFERKVERNVFLTD